MLYSERKKFIPSLVDYLPVFLAMPELYACTSNRVLFYFDFMPAFQDTAACSGASQLSTVWTLVASSWCGFINWPGWVNICSWYNFIRFKDICLLHTYKNMKSSLFRVLCQVGDRLIALSLSHGFLLWDSICVQLLVMYY